MRIRPYIPNKDYEYLSKWIDDERTHAFWSANRFSYPITPESFHDFLEKISIEWTDSAYVATENSGQTVGFFCYSVNTENNIGFLKFVIIDIAKRCYEKVGFVESSVDKATFAYKDELWTRTNMIIFK